MLNNQDEKIISAEHQKSEMKSSDNPDVPGTPGIKDRLAKNSVFYGKTLLVIIAVIAIFIYGKTVKTGPLEEKTEEIPHKSIIEQVVAVKSEHDGVRYVIDERYYDEHDILAYIGIMSGKEGEEISFEDVENYIDEVFIKIESQGCINLIKKDNKELVLGCDELDKQYLLDRKFMGVVNNEIIKKSKGFYISQISDKMAEMPYGASTMARSGCGPIALTMAINYASEEGVADLEEVASWSVEHNMYQHNAGTSWSLIRNYPPVIGVNSAELHVGTLEKFNSLLKEGEVLVTIMQKGHFTDNGHFIVITGIEDGKVSVLDPASISRSLHEWDAETVFKESKKYFWKISK